MGIQSAKSLNIFPTKIFRMQISMFELPVERLVERILERMTQNPSNQCSNIAGWRSGNDLFDWDSNTIQLKRLVCTGISDFMRQEKLLTDPEFELEGYAWANVLANGAFNQPHVHPNSFLSAVLYLRSGQPQCGGQLILMDPRGLAEMSQWPTAFLAEGEGYPIEPIPGELIVFPSWLRHWVAPYKSEEPRISIAMNFFPKHRQVKQNVL